MQTNHEISLIGLLIKQPNLIDSCQLLFNFANPFSNPSLNKIFGHIQQLCDINGKVDRRELLKLGKAEGVDLDLYGELSKNAGFEIQLADYVNNVYERHTKGLLSNMAHRLVNCDKDDLNSVSEYLRICRETIEGIEKASSLTTGVTIADAIQEVKTKTEMLQKGDDKHYIKFGVLAIDRLIIGVTTKTMSILAARPSIGKTACGITAMSNMMANNIACGFISVEMSEAELIERLAQVRSDVSVYEFNNGISQRDSQEFYRHLDGFGDCPLIQIQRTTNRRIGNIRNIARTMKNKNPELKVIFIDYIQKVMGSDSRQDMRTQVGEVSATLTDMATDLDVHVCALAQLSRAGEDVPKMSHLKESGRLEEDASYVFLIHRDLEEQRNSSGDELKELDTGILVAKNRGGRTGIANVKFNAITTRFYDGTFEHEQGEF